MAEYRYALKIALLIGLGSLGLACREDRLATVQEGVADARADNAEAARSDDGDEEDELLPGATATPATGPSTLSVDMDTRAQDNDDGIGKIVGGTAVTGANFADVVGIAKAGSSVLRCTGTLIERDVVLTAAHCICAGISGRVFVGNQVSQGGVFYDVIAKRHGHTARNEQICQPGTLKPRLDLAVLLLARPVTGVTPRPIAADGLVTAAKSYRAVGFGAVSRDAAINPRQKREAEIIAASNDCRGDEAGGPDEEIYGCQPGQEIVAGAVRDSTDTCKGDSGGPLFIGPQGRGRATSTGDYRLAGVTSRASSLSETLCGDGGIYERLTPVAREWIRRQVDAMRGQR